MRIYDQFPPTPLFMTLPVTVFECQIMSAMAAAPRPMRDRIGPAARHAPAGAATGGWDATRNPGPLTWSMTRRCTGSPWAWSVTRPGERRDGVDVRQGPRVGAHGACRSGWCPPGCGWPWTSSGAPCDTDEWKGCNGLPRIRRDHQAVDHSGPKSTWARDD